MTEKPTPEELEGYFTSLSNWGRWGADDRLGTLNLITNEQRAAAAALVSDGIAVSLGGDLDPANPDPYGYGTQLQRFVQEFDGGKDVQQLVGGDDVLPRFTSFREWVGLTDHGSHTHLDGLGHNAWQGRYYNGFSVSDTTSVDGATTLSMHHVREGVLTRGILLDIAGLRGEPWLSPGEPVYPKELEAAEERQGVRVGPGDALLMYTGNFRRVRAEGIDEQRKTPGYSPACLPWLKDRDVALISSDNINDVIPSGYESLNLPGPIHAVGIVAMGLWLLDNMQLDDLVDTCRRLHRWQFMFSMQPWRVVGTTGSPVNPIAVF